LPGKFADRVYSSFDKSEKGFITEQEFVTECIEYLTPNLDDKLKFVFRLFDFNNDSKVDSKDLWTLICEVPLQIVFKKLVD
jgi:Ca2+-binding EF-hand superfamily protein